MSDFFPGPRIVAKKRYLVFGVGQTYLSRYSPLRIFAVEQRTKHVYTGKYYGPTQIEGAKGMDY
jgi:hypothetical protein